MPRSPHGSVVVASREGRLMIRLPRKIFGGRQKIIYLAIADTSVNRKIAAAKAQRIELDILTGYFDPSLSKYTDKIFNLDSVFPLGKLFEKYVEFKKNSGISPSTIANDFSRTKRAIEKLPFLNFESDAILIRDWLLNTYSPNIARRNVVQISACCDWAIKSGFIANNPFKGLAKDIKVRCNSNQQVGFSKTEKDLIIQSFSTHKHHSFYTPLVKFLFLTGCRPSEALALVWEDLSNDSIIFRHAAVDSPSGLSIKSGLKTQQSRYFPINKQLASFFEAVPRRTNPINLIFPSIHGKVVNFRYFSQKIWKPVLQGLDISYRHPYCCRHTFISLCLEAGVGVEDVALWVGNSPEIIYRHYVGGKINLAVPEL